MKSRAMRSLAAASLLVAICNVAHASQTGGPQAAAANSRECASLVQLLSLPRADLLASTTQLQTRAFDAGDDCVAVVAGRLADTSGMTVGAAAYALSVIGSQSALAAVHAAVIGTAGDRARAGLPPDVISQSGESVLAAQYFSQAIEGPRLGPGWIPRHNAALTLGVLRAREGSDALRRAVGSSGNGTFVAQAASAALAWMNRAPCSLADAPSRDATTSLALAMLLCGVPTLSDTTTAFLEQRFDRTPVRVWTRGAEGWTHRAATASDNTLYPRVQFRSSFSSDSTRATSSVHTSEAPGNLTVYKYLIRRTGNAWRVTAISFGGVS